MAKTRNLSQPSLHLDFKPYTVFRYQGEYSATEGLEFKEGALMTTFPPDARVDSQVEARTGYAHRVVDGASAPWRFTGEKSGWSKTRTVTIS